MRALQYEIGGGGTFILISKAITAIRVIKIISKD